MAESYDEMAGTEMDVKDHPDRQMPDFTQRYPQAVMQARGPGNDGPNIDRAFSNVNDQFPLGNALRKKAKEMSK